MKKLHKVFIVLWIWMPFLGLSQSKIGIIKDKDGFTNIRTDRNSKSQIIAKVLEKEYFTYFENKKSSWWLMETQKGQIGYIHKSRVVFVQLGYVQNGKLTNKKVRAIEKNESLQEVIVKIIQLKPGEDFYDFSCKGLIRTIKKNKQIDQIDYGNIEPVGGNFGLTFSKNQKKDNVFIASKFGDYDGRIIIVDENGKIQNLEGGRYFVTNNGKYLVTEWHSDISGITIYDLKKNKVCLHKELDFYLGDWYFSNNIYFSPVWNGERDLEQTYQIDFYNCQLKKSKLKIDKQDIIKMENQDCYCN